MLYYAHSFPNNDPLKEEKHEEKSVSLLCLVDVGGLRRAGAVSFQTHEDKTMHAGQGTFSYNYASGYNFSPLVWAMGGGDIRVTMFQYTITWEAKSDGYIYYSITGTYNLHFSDTFTEPLDIPGV